MSEAKVDKVETVELCVMRDGHRWCGEPAVGTVKVGVDKRDDDAAASGSVPVCARHEAVLREVVGRHKKNESGIALADDDHPSEPRPIAADVEPTRNRDIPATEHVTGMRTTGTVPPPTAPPAAKRS